MYSCGFLLVRIPLSLGSRGSCLVLRPSADLRRATEFAKFGLQPHFLKFAKGRARHCPGLWPSDIIFFVFCACVSSYISAASHEVQIWKRRMN